MLSQKLLNNALSNCRFASATVTLHQDEVSLSHGLKEVNSYMTAEQLFGIQFPESRGCWHTSPNINFNFSLFVSFYSLKLTPSQLYFVAFVLLKLGSLSGCLLCEK
jgi:hypothetical protein